MNCQCAKGGQCDCGMCADLGRQGRDFDVPQDPEVLAVAQKIIGWIGIAAAVGVLITALPEVLPALLMMAGF